MTTRTKDHTYYRCKRCSRIEPPHQIEPGDDELPRADCGCYMGPNWEKVTLMTDRELNDLLSMAYQQGVEDMRPAEQTNKPVSGFDCTICGEGPTNGSVRLCDEHMEDLEKATRPADNESHLNEGSDA